MTAILTRSLPTEKLGLAVKELSAAIIAAGDQENSTVDERLSMLEALETFKLGRFFILNRCLNAYWTYYVISYPQWGPQLEANPDAPNLCPLEKEILETFTVFRASQERAQIFKSKLQQAIDTFSEVKSTVNFASVPCGLMADLIDLDYSKLQKAKCFGVDLDLRAITSSQEYLKTHTSLSPKIIVDYFQENAWDLSFHDAFDLITSNGLNIYERDDALVTKLYQRFFRALKPGGILLTSFLTPEYGMPLCPWDMTQVDLAAYKRQRIIFGDILNIKWQCFRSEQTTREQLGQAGFEDIEIIWDSQKVFPSVLAYKRA